MIRRKYIGDDATKDLESVIQKKVRRIWISFFIGLVTEALQIKPSKVTLSGVEIDFQNVTQLPGLFYLFIFTYTLYTLTNLVILGAGPAARQTGRYRQLIYIYAGKKKTFRNKTSSDIRMIKQQAKWLIALLNTYMVIILLFPFIIVLTFKFSQMISAVKLIVFGA